jgi:hypothetical protein
VLVDSLGFASLVGVASLLGVAASRLVEAPPFGGASEYIRIDMAMKSVEKRGRTAEPQGASDASDSYKPREWQGR